MLTIKTLEQRKRCRSGVLIDNFENVSHLSHPSSVKCPLGEIFIQFPFINHLLRMTTRQHFPNNNIEKSLFGKLSYVKPIPRIVSHSYMIHVRENWNFFYFNKIWKQRKETPVLTTKI